MPIIPLLGGILSLTGVATLVWYYSKPIAERKILDDKANKLAHQWYQLNIDQLSVKQVQKIYDEVKNIS